MDVGTLASLLSRGRWSRDNISLICDGTPSNTGVHASRNIEIIFTGGTKSADQEIMDRVSTSSSSNRIVVVTNDREIIRFIRARGAQHLGSVAFLEAIIEDHQKPTKQHARKPSGLSPDKAAAWKDEFALTDASIDQLEEEISLPIIETEDPPIHESKKSPVQKKPKPKKLPKPAPPPKTELPSDLIDEARKLADE
jgi:predicted RNA-binding protein with PIN domain